jgi:hypothetical protein
MSDRGQRIFKIIVWVVIFVLVAGSIISKARTMSEDLREDSYADDSQEVYDFMPVSLLDSVADDSIGKLSSDTIGLSVGEENEVKFSIPAKVSKDSHIELFKDDKKIATLNDKGKDGDDRAGDGIYSTVIALNPKEDGEEFIYHAEYKDQKSNEVSLCAYDEVTDEEWDKADALMEELVQVREKYVVDGAVPDDKVDEVIDELYQTALEYADAHGIVIKEISKDKEGISYILDNGLIYACSVPLEGVEAGDDEVYVKVVRLEPYITRPKALPSFENQAQYIDDEIDGVDYVESYEDSDVTMDNVEKLFQPDSFIIWHGHGYWSEERELSALMLGEMVTDETRKAYEKMYKAGKIILFESGKIALTYKFFENKDIDLENSFVYLGGCHTAQDGLLMNVMLRKNAEAVLGFDQSVLISYDSSIIDALSKYLCKTTETGDYYSLGLAMSFTVNECGISDKNGTHVVYEGNTEYNLGQNTPSKYDISGIDVDIDGKKKKAKDDIDKKIDDTVDKAVDSFMERLQKSIDAWFEENCGSC